MADIDLLVVGSPTHGDRFTKAIQELFKKSFLSVEGMNVVAFDTRTSSSGFTRHIENFFGRAAPRIANFLEKKGCVLIIEPEGFIVEGLKGPLLESELERAISWGNKISEIYNE
ncbi:MAG: flavodoxin family protein [Promethearchaeota archaeon]